jgi:UPF0755 protein
MLHRRFLALGALICAGCTVPEPPDAVWVTIPPGASLAAVADTLAAYDIVRSAGAFRRYARIGRKHLGIKPGTYPLRARTPMGKVLVLLRQGTPPVERIVIHARANLAETALTLEQWLGIPAESTLAAAADSALRARLGVTSATIEGYLFPTAYYVPVPATALDVLRQMADTFEARWRPRWGARLDALGLTRHELVTLASIIEGEVIYDDDRPNVSSVYHNRLRTGMRLQADPTVVYALGRRRRLYHGDYDIESEYNTYRINGLPPGPIAQPSLASLEAALYPPETDYLYFVAGRDSRHLFSRTYREHLNTIRRVRVRSATGRAESERLTEAERETAPATGS